MKHSSPTHVLGLLLAAAAATSGAAQEHMDHHHPPHHNGVGGPAPGHLEHHDHHHDHHHHDDKNAHTHGLLQAHVMGGAGAGGGSGIPPAAGASAGLEGDGGAELLHPLAHYMLGFFEWTAKYGRTWGSVKEASHALKVRPDVYVHTAVK